MKYLRVVLFLLASCGPDINNGPFIGGADATMEFARPVTDGFRRTLEAARFGFSLRGRINDDGEVEKIEYLDAYGAPDFTYEKTPCKRCDINASNPITFAVGTDVVVDLGTHIVISVEDFPFPTLSFPESADIRWMTIRPF